MAGTITDGLFAGATVDGIGYLLIRHDGVGVLDGRVFASLPDGTAVACSDKGLAGDPATMSPLESWFDPDLVPDMDVALHGAAWFQTIYPSDAYLNHTVLAMHGTVDLATCTIHAMAWSLAE